MCAQIASVYKCERNSRTICEMMYVMARNKNVDLVANYYK